MAQITDNVEQDKHLQVFESFDNLLTLDSTVSKKFDTFCMIKKIKPIETENDDTHINKRQLEEENIENQTSDDLDDSNNSEFLNQSDYFISKNNSKLLSSELLDVKIDNDFINDVKNIIISNEASSNSNESHSSKYYKDLGFADYVVVEYTDEQIKELEENYKNIMNTDFSLM